VHLTVQVVYNKMAMSATGKSGIGSTSYSTGTNDAIIPTWQLRMQRLPQSLPLEYPGMAAKLGQGPTSLFKGTFQSGFISILYAIGQRPLEIWEKQVIHN